MNISICIYIYIYIYLNYVQNLSEHVKNGKHSKTQHYALCSNKIKVSVSGTSRFQEICFLVAHLLIILRSEYHIYKVPKASYMQDFRNSFPNAIFAIPTNSYS